MSLILALNKVDIWAADVEEAERGEGASAVG